MSKGLIKIKYSFSEPCLTHFGGITLICAFCNKIKLRSLLSWHIRYIQRKSIYHPNEMILAIMYSIIAGLGRINKTTILQYNGAFQNIVGLKNFPEQSAIRRFLKRLSPKEIRQIVRLHDLIRNSIFYIDKPKNNLIFDLDSVVITVYGKLHRAQVGYNVKKPGRRSFHPLLAFEAHNHEFWHGSLRPGNTTIASGAIAFMKKCLAKVPKHIAKTRIRVRVDSGLFNRYFIEFLEEQKIGYAIVAKEYKTIKTRAKECAFTQKIHDWEFGQFTYTPHKWKKEHRFVVCRRPIPDDPEEAQQLTLFKTKKYAYHVIVTNLPISPRRVWLFYSKRAGIELNIKELLYDFNLSKIPSKYFLANVAYFQLLLFAYNIVHWFKRLCLPKEYHLKTLDTIRRELIVLPGKLIKSGNRNILKLPMNYHFEKDFLTALKNIQKLKSLKLN